MRIATYNLHFGGKDRVHWNHLLDEHAPEILLVQESYPPLDHLPESVHRHRHLKAVWSPAESKGKTMKWGSGIYVESGGQTRLTLPGFDGWVVGAEIERFRRPSVSVQRTASCIGV